MGQFLEHNLITPDVQRNTLNESYKKVQSDMLIESSQTVIIDLISAEKASQL